MDSGDARTADEVTIADIEAVQERYTRFAREEAPGRSALYETWAWEVSRDAGVAGVLARLVHTRRQPPLVFAVARWCGAPEDDGTTFTRWVRAHADLLVAETAKRSLQTNEPLRCAALLPALAGIEEPIALIEVGASAGLCLYPDRYSYRYRHPNGDVTVVHPDDGPSTVVLECELVGEPPLRMPHVVWRAGIDLAPLDARNEDDVRWLRTLVWPGETGREARVSAALRIAATDPPLLVQGDAANGLAVLIAHAPAGARVVVSTPGVLVHIPRAARAQVIEAARRADHWVSIDPAFIYRQWQAIQDATADDAALDVDLDSADFVLGIDGELAGVVDPLGSALRWRGSDVARGRG